MLKKELIEKLQNEINKLKEFPDKAKFNEIVLIKEKPKCPQCGEYEGKNFSSGGFIYHQEYCKSCGYSFTEE